MSLLFLPYHYVLIALFNHVNISLWDFNPLLRAFDFVLRWNQKSDTEKVASMHYPNLSREEIAQRGEKLYQQSIHTRVETAGNIGKIIAINITTGDYEIDDDLIVACHRLQAKQPNAIIWTERIGYDAVFAVGGTLVRTAQ
ncbi:hypothetical protein [Nostoc sp. UCD120]|uniref:hypothetical protein n=1 Tax=Nostoc sp. UCD120 TaxID=2681312 RepID=UPI002892A38A|nr:hypothetical protein [Nostoc sp. UCD120]